jgi:hypothetical protein
LVEQLAVAGAREICTEAGEKHGHFLGMGVWQAGRVAERVCEACLRLDRALGSSRRSEVDTPRHRETGRPPAAQFAPWAVYVHGGGTTSHGRKELG